MVYQVLYHLGHALRSTLRRKGWPHHRGLRPPLFPTSGGGSFTSHKNQINESALRRDLQFFVLIREGSVESLNICRCNYKGSTFFSIIQRPWALVRPGFKPVTSCSADRHLPTKLTRRQFWGMSFDPEICQPIKEGEASPNCPIVQWDNISNLSH